MQKNSVSRPTLSKVFKVFFDNPLTPKTVWRVLPPRLTVVVIIHRDIARSLIHIKANDEKQLWIAKLIKWEKKYGHLLYEKTIGFGTKKKWWYTHGNLRCGWRLLTNNWNPFFVHLDHKNLPHSNNSLEGTISQMKNKLINHRGMKTPQQVLFTFWHLTFTRVKTRLDLKKLWGVWKKSQ